MMNRLLIHSLLALIVCLGFLAPDFILQYFIPAVKTIFSIRFALIIYALSWFLISCNKYFRYFIFFIFFTAQSIELFYIAYFGGPIGIIEAKKIFIEVEDICESGFAHWRDVYIVAPVLIISYALPLLAICRFHRYILKVPFAFFMVLVALLIQPFRAVKSNLIWVFYPNSTKHSLYNGINLLSSTYFLYSKNITSKSYKPYSLKFNQPIADNIVLIFGESCNYPNMSLYGYERKTTPYLDSLKNDSNFAYKKGISGAVATVVAMPTFFSLMREVANVDHVTSNKANLFRFAKKQGFYNFWISNQRASLMTSYAGMNYIDHVFSRDSMNQGFTTTSDKVLVEQLKQLQLKDKNFITLHQRNIHTPYDKNYSKDCPQCSVYPAMPDNRKQNVINLYDNAMIYDDMIWREIIEFCKSNFKGTTYIILTSDHAEALGAKDMSGNELYSHHHMHQVVTKVPFVIYAINDKNNIIEQVKQFPEYIAHYEIGHLIAHLMGVEIINPNIQSDALENNTLEDIFYVHADVFNNYRYLKVKRNGDTVRFFDQGGKEIVE